MVKHIGEFAQTRLRSLVTPCAAVADVGCGEQPLRSLVEAQGAVYTGIDIDQNEQGTVDVIAGVTCLPLPDAEFDVVVCTEVLEHVSDTYQAFHELTRITKSGGYIIVTTPFAFPLHEIPFDFVRLTPYQLQECAGLSGLTVRELAVTGNELEALATGLDHTCSNLIKSWPRFLRIPILVLLRSAINALAMLGTGVVGKRLPKAYFLGTCCVFEKASAVPRST